MATKPVTITPLPIAGGENAYVASWTLANGDVGEAIGMEGWSDRSVQASGTFGSGGSVSLKGSNNNSTYEILRDPASVALTFTSAGLKQVLENTRVIRPECTAGDGTTAIVVSVLLTRPRA